MASVRMRTVTVPQTGAQLLGRDQTRKACKIFLHNDAGGTGIYLSSTRQNSGNPAETEANAAYVDTPAGASVVVEASEEIEGKGVQEPLWASASGGTVSVGVIEYFV